jgi:hypothetical protein
VDIVFWLPKGGDHPSHFHAPVAALSFHTIAFPLVIWCDLLRLVQLYLLDTDHHSDADWYAHANRHAYTNHRLKRLACRQKPPWWHQSLPDPWTKRLWIHSRIKLNLCVPFWRYFHSYIWFHFQFLPTIHRKTAFSMSRDGAR